MFEEAKIKVMMLDDERFLLDIYKIAFEKHGFDVMQFYDADKALETLRTGYDPDVILFDLTMPEGKSGYEFLEIVQSEGLSKRSLKVALTNEGADGEKARTQELGADGHIIKVTMIPSELATKVTEMLKAKQ